jgi:hypothetical protein
MEIVLLLMSVNAKADSEVLSVNFQFASTIALGMEQFAQEMEIVLHQTIVLVPLDSQAQCVKFQVVLEFLPTFQMFVLQEVIVPLVNAIATLDIQEFNVK